MPDIYKIQQKECFICDMDGVLYHGNKLLDGVSEFVNWLKRENKKYLFLTNAADKTAYELQQKLSTLGVDVPSEAFYTSAMVTASFLAEQCPGGSAYIIGDAGIRSAMLEVGFSENDTAPDYVIVSETNTYNYEQVKKAINLVMRGAKLIGTNPDIIDPVEDGFAPATKSLIAPIEVATGKRAYFTGKPNPLIVRNALRKIQCTHEQAIIIGDRMDTDIIAGIEAGIDTVLVLSGISSIDTMEEYAYRPGFVINGVGDIAQ